MAYEVTATRRRPKTFDEMAGQEYIVATLKSSIVSGRIAHAYLFSGPRGCGKTSAARILARSLNCVEGPTVHPCGVCSNCVEISRGTSMDVIEIDGASNTSVNDVRQIKDEVLFPPNSGKYKIYIIDEVHMLSNSAFNALLKTIEEPPPYIIFIFATTELHKVPATIRSRCQQFNFRLFSVDTIKELLAKACDEENIQAEEEALFWIAKEATGSMRDAYTLFDQVAAFSDGILRSEQIQEKLGLLSLDAINKLAEACAETRIADALTMTADILDRGVAIEQFIIDLASYYRSLLLLKNGVTRAALIGFNPEEYSQKVLAALDPLQLERAVVLLLNLYRDVRYSVSPRFELETAISHLCWLTRWVSPAELRGTLNGLRTYLLKGGSPRGDPPENTTSEDSFASNEQALETEPHEGKGLDLNSPGAFTEGFKRFLAERDSENTPDPEPEVSPVEDLNILEPATAETQELKKVEDIEEIRLGVIASLRKERGMLASGLEKSLEWEWKGKCLHIPVADSLSADLLRKDSAAIGKALRTVNDSLEDFDIIERTDQNIKPGDTKEELAPQTELVRRLFRGTVVQTK